MTRQATPTIIAVDPGLTGAIAFYNPASPTDAEVFDLTQHAHSLHRLIASRTNGLERAVVELVNGRPGQRGVFTFGFGTGLVHGVLGCLGYEVETISPVKWKPAMGLTGADKNVSRALAAQLFPHLSKDLARVKDDGRAEALLIAVFASAQPVQSRNPHVRQKAR